MSGIYIVGYEFPQDGQTYQIFIDGRGKVYEWLHDAINDENSLADAFAVPDHGDLIDRAEMREVACYLLDKATTDQEANLVRELWSHFAQLPIIIPAEEN